MSRDRRGIVTVEFALVATSVIILTPIIWDLASVVNHYMALSSSVRAGVQLALVQPANTTGITQTIQAANGLNSATVNTSQFCECTGISATCGSVCSGTTLAAKFMTITAAYSVPTLLPYYNYPANSFAISQSTTVRIE